MLPSLTAILLVLFLSLFPMYCTRQCCIVVAFVMVGIMDGMTWAYGGLQWTMEGPFSLIIRQACIFGQIPA